MLRIAAVFICLASAIPAFSDDETEKLWELFEKRHRWRLREYPGFAMSVGDYRYADRIAEAGLDAVHRRHEVTKGHLQQLREIDRDQLGAQDLLNYDLFEQLLQEDIDGFRFRMYLAPLNSRDGPHQQIGQMHERVRFRDARDYSNYLKRLEQVPGRIDDMIERMRLGVHEGLTPPRVTLDGLLSELDAQLAGGLKVLAEPFDELPDSVSDSERLDLRARFDGKSFPAVQGAIAKFRDFVVETYLPGCRTTIAACDLPQGKEFYAFALRRFTTTELSAQEIHDIGQREVQRIKAEMKKVIRSSDFLEKNPEAGTLDDPELFRAFLNYLRTDQRFYYNTEEALLSGYRDICKRIDAELPRLFVTIPRLPYGVRKIPDFMAPKQTTAYYSRGDIRNAQSGTFYANTYALDQRPRYEMIALALHEAVPGHHFQVAIAQELQHVPPFRRHAWFTAFGEGWALYAERLGLEVGFYTDPYDDFGRLLYEMWRSCRLVVDTGMHALGWSRDRAVQFMLENTALSELNINNEIDRYISWPGQATAYKIGELKIRELRARAEDKLQAQFDIRAFHDVVLGAGSIPLNILEQRVDTWIAEVGAQAASNR